MIGHIVISVLCAAGMAAAVIATGGSAALALAGYASAGSMCLILLGAWRGLVHVSETADRSGPV
jgi:hypothetical protein